MGEPLSTDAAASAAADPQADPETWVDRHGDVLYRYALARVRDKPVAEDLVQETLLAAIRTLDSYKGTSAERTWLVGIMRHKLLDHFRARTRDGAIPDHDGHGGEPPDEFDENGSWKDRHAAWQSPERSLEHDEFWQTFDTCLDDLPEHVRTPFMLREFDGLDTNSLTELLKITKNNLWVLLSRARQKMRHCLQLRWFEA